MPNDFHIISYTKKGEEGETESCKEKAKTKPSNRSREKKEKKDAPSNENIFSIGSISESIMTCDNHQHPSKEEKPEDMKAGLNDSSIPQKEARHQPAGHVLTKPGKLRQKKRKRNWISSILSKKKKKEEEEEDNWLYSLPAPKVRRRKRPPRGRFPPRYNDIYLYLL